MAVVPARHARLVGWRKCGDINVEPLATRLQARRSVIGRVGPKRIGPRPFLISLPFVVVSWSNCPNLARHSSRYRSEDRSDLPVFPYRPYHTPYLPVLIPYPTPSHTLFPIFAACAQLTQPWVKRSKPASVPPCNGGAEFSLLSSSNASSVIEA